MIDQMTGQWKDRIIRGGAIAVMTVAALGGMVGLTGIMAGYPGALRAGGIILAAAACIGAVCLAEEGLPVHLVQGRRRPVQHLHQVKECNWVGLASCWKSACRTGAGRCQTDSRQLKGPLGAGVCLDHSTQAENTP